MNYYSSDISARPVTTSLDFPALMRQVYAWMFVGLLITGGVAWYVGSQTQLVYSIFRNPLLLLVLVFAQLGLAIFLGARIAHMKTSTAAVLFTVFAGTMGITISSIFVRYTDVVIANAFFVTSLTFGAVSLFAYTTRIDLSRMGNILYVALFGLLIATIANIFMRSSGLFWVLNYAGVVIFVGLTAYKTQRIKNWAMNIEMMNGGVTQYSPDGSVVSADDTKRQLVQRLAILGALDLYLSFVNLFMYILQIMGAGSRR